VKSVLLLDEDESILPFGRSTLRLTTEGGNDIFPSLPATGWPTYGGTKLQVSPSRIAASGSWALAQDRKFAKGQDRSRLAAVCKPLHSIGGLYKVELLARDMSDGDRRRISA